MKRNNEVLKQHSALTTFKIPKNIKFITNDAERSILFMLNLSQKDTQIIFTQKIENLLNRIFINKEAKNQLMQIIFKIEHVESKELNINYLDMNMSELSNIALEYKDFLKDKLKFTTLTDEDKLKYIKNQEESNLLKYAIKKQSNKLFNSNEDIKELLLDIKSFAKLLTIKEYSGEKILNLTSLKNALNITNVTKLKKDIKAVTGLFLDFNYINRKNLKVETRATYISSVSFETKGNEIFIKYEIPDSIMTLLITPSYYAEIVPLEVFQLKGKYSIRLYCLIKDYLFKRSIEISREEFSNFLKIPKSALSRKAHLMDLVIEPALAEIYSVCGIEVKYELKPDTRNFEKIKFTMKQTRKSIVSEPNININKEPETFYDYQEIMYLIEQMKANVYINKLWNKRVINKIQKVFIEKGKLYLMDLLNRMLLINSELNSTLVSHMNKLIKFMNKEDNYKKVNRKVKIQKIMDKKKKDKEKVKTISLLEKCVKESRQLINGKFVVTIEEMQDEYEHNLNEWIKDNKRKPNDNEALKIMANISKYFILE